MPPMLSLGAGAAQGLRRGHTGGSLTAAPAPCKTGLFADRAVRQKRLTNGQILANFGLESLRIRANQFESN